MQKNKFIITILILSIFLLAISMGDILPGIANFHKNKTDVLSEAGLEISRNIKNIDALNKYLLSEDIEETDILAIVENKVAISSFEFQLRKSLHEAFGTYQTPDELFKKLLTEKIILLEAQKLELLPTEKEVQEFINWQKEQIEVIGQDQEILKIILEAGNLNEDEYWNVYERYNTIRILTEKKLYDVVINSAVNNGDLPPVQDEQISMEELRKRENYFINYIENLKSNANVQIKDNKGMG